jgi:hypothetical protein
MWRIVVGEEGAMKPLELPALTAEQVEAVATLYRTTHNVRLRTRAQMVLLAAEQQLGVREIAAIVRSVKARSAAGSNATQRTGSTACRISGRAARRPR